MTERNPFEERLAHDLAAIADSRFTAVDPHATADAAFVARPQPIRRWGRPLASVAVIVVAIGVGFSAASLLPKPPGASSTPTSSSVSTWGHIRWERAPADPGIGHDPMLNQWMGGVVAGGPGFVAWGLDEKQLADGIGASMAIWVSEDALTWHEVTFEPGETLSYRFSVMDIAAGPQGLVASGAVCCTEVEPGFWLSTPARWFSPDGEHWNRVPSVGLQPDPERAMAVVAGHGGFVEVGSANNQPTVWLSSDGTSWTAIALDVGDFSSGIVNDITTDAYGYVAVGEVSNTKEGIANEQGSAMVWRSIDGVDWVRAGRDDSVLRTGPIFRLERVVSYPGGLFAIGTRALPLDQQTCYPAPSGHFGPWRPSCVTSERVHLLSPKGEEWTELPIDEFEGELGSFPARVINGDHTGLMVIGPAYEPDAIWPVHSLWNSPDGVEWTRAVEDPPLESEDLVHAFVVVGDRIVAVGQNNNANSAAVWIGTRVDEAAASPSPTSRVTYPSGCGISFMLDYLASIGATPDAAIDAFIESVRARQPADAKAEAEREAILASASSVANEGVVEGETRYVARDSDGVLAIYALGVREDGGYVVNWYWVRLPDEFCDTPRVPSPTPQSTPTSTGLTEEQAVAIARDAAPQSADRDVIVAEVGLMEELEPGWSYNFFLPADRQVWRIVLSTTGPPQTQGGSTVFIDFLDGRVYGVVDWIS